MVQEPILELRPGLENAAISTADAIRWLLGWNLAYTYAFLPSLEP